MRCTSRLTFFGAPTCTTRSGAQKDQCITAAIIGFKSEEAGQLNGSVQSVQRSVPWGDTTKGEKAYQDAARIVVDEAAGVWVYNTKYFGPWAKNLDGIRFSPIGNGQEMRWVYYR